MVTKTEKSLPLWKKKAPMGTRHVTLSPEEKREAKARAEKAGRPYPNLVDNMWAAKKKKAGTL